MEGASFHRLLFDVIMRLLLRNSRRVANGIRKPSFAITSLQPNSCFYRCTSSWSNHMKNSDYGDRPVWSEEWKTLGLGAKLVDEPKFPKTLMFVEVGFGVDQHGDSKDATKAAVRAVRNAIEFNSIPGVIEHIPGGRSEMMIHCKLGVPAMISVTDDGDNVDDTTMHPQKAMQVDVLHVAKVFPYGKLLPIQIVLGGLDFPTGRIVEELGDTNDKACCVVACITIGYGTPTGETSATGDIGADVNATQPSHTTYNTRDGY